MEDAGGITPDQRNPGEKLTLLLESKTLDEEQKGEWLRQNGLHSEHLPLWEQELITVMNNKQSDLNKDNPELICYTLSLSGRVLSGLEILQDYRERLLPERFKENRECGISNFLSGEYTQGRV